jgi:hypothetical protein
MGVPTYLVLSLCYRFIHSSAPDLRFLTEWPSVRYCLISFLPLVPDVAICIAKRGSSRIAILAYGIGVQIPDVNGMVPYAATVVRLLDIVWLRAVENDSTVIKPIDTWRWTRLARPVPGLLDPKRAFVRCQSNAKGAAQQ